MHRVRNRVTYGPQVPFYHKLLPWVLLIQSLLRYSPLRLWLAHFVRLTGFHYGASDELPAAPMTAVSMMSPSMITGWPALSIARWPDTSIT